MKLLNQLPSVQADQTRLDATLDQFLRQGHPERTLPRGPVHNVETVNPLDVLHNPEANFAANLAQRTPGLSRTPLKRKRGETLEGQDVPQSQQQVSYAPRRRGLNPEERQRQEQKCQEHQHRIAELRDDLEIKRYGLQDAIEQRWAWSLDMQIADVAAREKQLQRAERKLKGAEKKLTVERVIPEVRGDDHDTDNDEEMVAKGPEELQRIGKEEWKRHRESMNGGQFDYNAESRKVAGQTHR